MMVSMTIEQSWTGNTLDPEGAPADIRANVASTALFELLAAHPDVDLASVRMAVTNDDPAAYTVTVTAS